MFKVDPAIQYLPTVKEPEGYKFLGAYDRDNMDWLLMPEFEDLKWTPCSAFAFYVGQGVATGLFKIEHHPQPGRKAGYFYLYSRQGPEQLSNDFEQSIYTVRI